jgi:hypothetical protein
VICPSEDCGCRGPTTSTYACRQLAASRLLLTAQRRGRYLGCRNPGPTGTPSRAVTVAATCPGSGTAASSTSRTASAETARHPPGHLIGQPRLARGARSGHRHQAVPGWQRVYRGDLVVAADKLVSTATKRCVGTRPG